MKKIYVLALLILICLTGCSEVEHPNSLEPTLDSTLEEIVSGNESYNILTYGFSDSAVTFRETEYTFEDYESYANHNIQETFVLSLGDLNIKGNYYETSYRGEDYFPSYEYRTGDKIFFSVDPDGKLTSYFNFSKNDLSSEKEKKLSQEECVKIAKEFVSQIIDISQYSVSVAEKNDKYEISFVKYVDGIETADSATVVVTLNGMVYSYSSFMLDRISVAAKNPFDIDDVKLQVLNKLKKDNVDLKGYDEIRYEVFDPVLTVLKNGDTALLCYADIEYVNTYNSGISLQRGERVRMVITEK